MQSSTFHVTFIKQLTSSLTAEGDSARRRFFYRMPFRNSKRKVQNPRLHFFTCIPRDLFASFSFGVVVGKGSFLTLEGLAGWGRSRIPRGKREQSDFFISFLLSAKRVQELERHVSLFLFYTFLSDLYDSEIPITNILTFKTLTFEWLSRVRYLILNKNECPSRCSDIRLKAEIKSQLKKLRTG